MTTSLASAITNAYDLSSILRVCVRSLEGDAPEQPGDGAATAHTVKLAGNMVGDLISTLELVELRGEGPDQDASLRTGAVALLDQWKAARRSRDALMQLLPTEQEAEPADLGTLDVTIERLAEQISCHQPQLDEDAATMLEWCVEDCAGELLCEQYPRAQKAVIEYLRTKA
ncbi:hypothetical protein SAMN04488523_105312 [Sulfitobacter brevis]|uniref:Uncharacterized protein n=1 Tax=Sulfitobacter brevis TaxID=74348 RepID=A0A1I1YMW1_9RHOB|nr:hypothetical protein [Sulfitobacter brevis]SFE20642.1 hypothetical protein SAMN04488523_105312 [Sulfitobacter brevis]